MKELDMFITSFKMVRVEHFFKLSIVLNPLNNVLILILNLHHLCVVTIVKGVFWTMIFF